MAISASNKTEKSANVRFKSSSVPQKKHIQPKQIFETNSKKSFAFGSSTPRELSHINKVPRDSRLIDTNVQNKKDLTINNNKNNHNLSYYMRQARSITPNLINSGHCAKSWAFGSSTPREFSHLNCVKSQRIYDAKLQPAFASFPDSKSAMTLAEKTAENSKNQTKILSKRSQEKKQQNENIKSKMNANSSKLNRTENISAQLSDDASSEPDLVQDRGTDLFRPKNINPTFGFENKQSQKNLNLKENEKTDKTNEKNKSNISIENKTLTENELKTEKKVSEMEVKKIDNKIDELEYNKKENLLEFETEISPLKQSTEPVVRDMKKSEIEIKNEIQVLSESAPTASKIEFDVLRPVETNQNNNLNLTTQNIKNLTENDLQLLTTNNLDNILTQEIEIKNDGANASEPLDKAMLKTIQS